MGRLTENQENSNPLKTLTATCTEYTTLQQSVIVFSLTSVTRISEYAAKFTLHRNSRLVL
jgi:hypothetical protein